MSSPGDGPMISVVIPVYNGACFLAAAISSVLAQTLPPGEIIVADDGSVDGSAEIAAGFAPAVRLLRLPHRGGAPAINAGIAEARGEYLAFLDADDLWAPAKLAEQSAALAADADVDAMLGGVVNFTDPRGMVVLPEQVPQPRQAVAGVSKGAMLIRRPAFDRVGWFDESRVADFPDWYARALAVGIRFAEVSSVVAFRRVHGANLTSARKSELHRDYLDITRAAIARKASPAGAKLRGS